MRNKKRGLTLVLALFVTFLLATLSVAFVTLMMEDSRGSRSSAWQVMAAESAEWGIETSLSYMGRGGNWQAAFDPDRLLFYDLLDPAQPNGQRHLEASLGGAGGINVEVEAGQGDDSAMRRLTLLDPSLPAQSVLSLDGDLLARVTVEVRPLEQQTSSFGPGQAPQYTLTSLAELYRADDMTKPVAISQLEAQVRPEVATTALFQVQNLRSWDVQGGGLGNATLADRIMIPSDYQSAGSVRVTGVDPTDPNAVWSAHAGNVKFQSPTSPQMVFKGQLSVSELNNLDAGGAPVTGNNPANFPGGVVYGSDFVPLPDQARFLNQDRDGNGRLGSGNAPTGQDLGSPSQEWGALAVAALDFNGPDSGYGPLVSGYYRVGKELISQAHSLHPRTPNLASGIPLDRQDYRPPVPEVEVVLKSGGFLEVNVWEANYGDGGITTPDGNLNPQAAQQVGATMGPLGQTLHVSQLKNGVLYVEGGQVVVRSELNGGVAAEFEGRLQIVAAEDGVRRRPNSSTSQAIYHDGAQEFFDYNSQGLSLPSNHPNYVSPTDFKAPPYTADQLEQAFAQGHITQTSGLSSVAGDSPFWPPPASSVEREGNLVIAGDILKKDGSSSVLGLTAENYLLINDRTLGRKAVPNEIKVDGVLTSFEHSLQLDWDNSSNNRVQNGTQSAYQQTMSNGFNGKILMKGSMLAPYSDVEGDLQGRGYPRQEFVHDQDLARWAPPYQPRTLLSDYPNEQITIAWAIIDFKDRTSRGVRLSNPG